MPNDIENLIKAARSGDLEQVKELLRLGVDAKSKCEAGTTALHEAVESGHLGVFKVLARKSGMYALDQKGRTVLEVAAKKGHKEMVEKMLSKWGKRKGDVVFSAANMALRHGQKECAQMLLEHPSGAKLTLEDGEPSAMFAALGGSLECLRLAVKHKPWDPKAATQEGATVLMRAAEGGNIDCVQEVLSLSDPMAVDKAGRSALSFAAKQGHGLIVKLLAPLSDVNKADWNNKTPMHWAAESGSADSVKELSKQGALLDAETEEGRTPLELAASQGRASAIEALLRAGAKPARRNTYFKNALMMAASVDLSCVKLLAGCFDLAEKDCDGWTALHFAAHSGSFEIAQSLATPQLCALRDSNGLNPLGRSAFSGRFQTVEAFARFGGLDNRDKDGDTALMGAALKGCVNSAKALLEAGADQKIKNKAWHTAFMKACADGKFEVASMLVDSDIGAIDRTMATALMKACEFGSEPCARLALPKGDEQAKAAVRAVDMKGRDALIWWCAGESPEAPPAWLVELGNAKNADYYGRTALMHAARDGRGRAVEALMDTSDLNAQDEDGYTALMYAIAGGKEEIAKALAMKSDLGARDENGKKASDWALSRDCGDLGGWLCELEASKKDKSALLESVRSGMDGQEQTQKDKAMPVRI